MKNKLVAILNTEHNMERFKSGSMTKQDFEEKAVYLELDKDSRKKTFSQLLKEMTSSGEGVANEVKDYYAQHNGHNLICEVRAYDEGFARKRNKKGSEIIRLDEAIGPYIDSRSLKSGEEYDCIEITADLYSEVGGLDAVAY